MLEFGVACGRTITIIAEQMPGPVYEFDSFEGLPESWYSRMPAGNLCTSPAPAAPSNVPLVKGWFNNTLPGFSQATTFCGEALEAVYWQGRMP